MSIIKNTIREKLKHALRLILSLFLQEIRATFFNLGSLPGVSLLSPWVASPFVLKGENNVK